MLLHHLFSPQNLAVFCLVHPISLSSYGAQPATQKTNAPSQWSQ